MRSAILVAAALFAGCSSSNEETTAAVDSAVDSSADTPSETASDAPTDTRVGPVCPVTGACLDEFAAKQKLASECFGHFGLGACGTFNSEKTTCSWPDGTSFDVVPEDSGPGTVVYKNKSGTECFRRLGNGDVIFADGSKYKTALATMKLTVTCSSGMFTCNSVADCIACGIDLRVCCM